MFLCFLLSHRLLPVQLGPGPSPHPLLTQLQRLFSIGLHHFFPTKRRYLGGGRRRTDHPTPASRVLRTGNRLIQTGFDIDALFTFY